MEGGRVALTLTLRRFWDIWIRSLVCSICQRVRKGVDDGGEGEVVLLQSRDLGGDRRHPSGETNFDSLFN